MLALAGPSLWDGAAHIRGTISPLSSLNPHRHIQGGISPKPLSTEGMKAWHHPSFLLLL